MWSRGFGSALSHRNGPALNFTSPELRGVGAWVYSLASSLAIELIVSPAPVVPFLFEKGCENDSVPGNHQNGRVEHSLS